MEAHSFTAIGAISINKIWKLMTKSASINEIKLSYLLNFFIFLIMEHIGSSSGDFMRQKTSINYAKN